MINETETKREKGTKDEKGTNYLNLFSLLYLKIPVRMNAVFVALRFNVLPFCFSLV